MEFPASCSRSVESTMPTWVLVVDDEPDILDVLNERLLREGDVVETASTGAAAIASVRGRTPDAVLLDLNMPGALDGRAVLGGSLCWPWGWVNHPARSIRLHTFHSAR
jgi:PleD family two-component response regulator